MDTRDLLAHAADALGMDTDDEDGPYPADALAESIADDVLDDSIVGDVEAARLLCERLDAPLPAGGVWRHLARTLGVTVGDAKRIVAVVNAPATKRTDQTK
jgi:hypothetical protein